MKEGLKFNKFSNGKRSRNDQRSSIIGLARMWPIFADIAITPLTMIPPLTIPSCPIPSWSTTKLKKIICRNKVNIIGKSGNNVPLHPLGSEMQAQGWAKVLRRELDVTFAHCQAWMPILISSRSKLRRKRHRKMTQIWRKARIWQGKKSLKIVRKSKIKLTRLFFCWQNRRQIKILNRNLRWILQ